ncbi:proline:sodium symporter [Alkalihalobacillus alcalophilus ATCC 27647 = CGMCC 1.3604]|uniref:Sodium/proline symporter n=2 Tax=Alkalihalobacillus alcalophilus ATCC 27647 = CGMCC 1.3604 TaxID=1218173 RepID=A0A094YS15_ALKAL|nr:sodium/proline symporter PutP [Alkalihalobacillus alcalophilus]KGA96247.1 proline:sodium symporter PutP [Alkalihalobacillus alcalophilus ATCC 27647 = CGMCC 1.3604]MED1562338.1 sodium/proline symporter PutP [Alkalihalobacillus alcalophilus]THG90626.1 proline:sodium symporter [Alkalihalobacillus alcalophilus ATCC 27647 = CGMCC 1.3604]
MGSISQATFITFIFYMVVLLAFGLYAYFKTKDLSDYVLGGRKLGGATAALSAGASDMSSWLLLGLPGAIYVGGMSEIWIAVGLAIGAYLNWQFLAKRLRLFTEKAKDSITIPDFFENRFEDSSKVLRVISAIVILVFFTFYSSSGLVAGALLFQSSFGMGYTEALWIGALVIVSYTFVGGFLAVSWSDLFQGTLMFLALVIVPVVAITEIGGWNETVQAIGQIDTAYLDAFQGVGFIAMISLLAWGLGYFGQPHIITRFMAIKSTKELPKAQAIGMTWMILSLFGAVFTGLAGLAYFSEFGPAGTALPENQEETVFILFTQLLMNEWVAGFLIAAILSAIMSTIDSQLLVSSSALAEDFYKPFFRKKASQKELMWVGRIGVLLIAFIAILLAYNPESSVLELVSYAWAGFGSAFGPVLLLALFWRRMTRNGALTGMIVGGLTVIIWAELERIVGWFGVSAESFNEIAFFSLYEIIPGFILAGLAAIIVSLAGKEPSKTIQAQFDEVKQLSDELK